MMEISKDRVAKSTRKTYERRLEELARAGCDLRGGPQPSWTRLRQAMGVVFRDGSRRDPREYVRAARFEFRARGWEWRELDGQVMADAGKALAKRRKEDEWKEGKKELMGRAKGLTTEMIQRWKPKGTKEQRTAKKAIARLAWRLLLRGDGVGKLLVNQVVAEGEWIHVVKVFHKTVNKGGRAKRSSFRRRAEPGEMGVGKALGRWLKLRAKLEKEGKIEGRELFWWPVKGRGKGMRWRKVTSRDVGVLAEEIAGGKKGFGSHAFRRGAARALFEAGTDLDRIMLEGGWTSRGTLAHYIQVPLLKEQERVLTKG